MPKAKWQGRRDGPVALGLWALAAAVRLLFLFGHGDQEYPFSVFYYGDSRVYREFALAILDGRAYDSGLPFHPPLFAWVMAGAIDAVGARPALIRALLALVGALAVPLTYLLGVRLLGRAPVAVGALLATFSFALCVAAVSPNAEVVYVPLLVGQALATVALGASLAGDGRSRRRWIALAVATGALAGLGALTRAEHLAFLALVPAALFIARKRDGLRRTFAASAVVAATGMAVVAPWTFRNRGAIAHFNAEHPGLAEALPTFVPVTSYGALNFALANHPDAQGGFDPLPLVGERGSGVDLLDPRQLDLYLHGYRRGLAALAASPGRALRLAGAKLAIAADAFALGFGTADRPAELAGLRRPVDLFAPASRVLLPFALGLTAAGAWLARRQARPGAVVWLTALLKALVCVAFFGYVRLFAQLLPFAFLLQGRALMAAAGLLPGPRLRRALAAAGVGVALLLMAELAAGVAAPRNYVVSGSSDARGKIIQNAALTITPTPRQ